jgi:hypothetical protein
MIDRLFSVKSYRTPLCFFVIALTALLSSLFFCTYQPLVLEHQRIMKYHLNEQYLSQFHQWMFLLNTTVSPVLHKFSVYHDEYRQSHPFPHLVGDHLFPSSIVAEMMKEFPEDPKFNPNLKKGIDCVEGAECSRDKNHAGVDQFHKPEFFGPATAAVFMFLKSSQFVNSLEQLTGLKGLIPDYLNVESGLHQVMKGGIFGIHSNPAPSKESKPLRQVKVELYLNPDWVDEFAGHLELWSTDLTQCSKAILPTAGRVAIMALTERTFAGHPRPLTSPHHRSRRSLSVTYYTAAEPGASCSYSSCSLLEALPPLTFVSVKCSCADKRCGGDTLKHTNTAIDFAQA